MYPGPDHPSHLEALLRVVDGRPLKAIICTPTHRDHSPASRPLQQATGAPILGCAPLVLDDDGPRADASFDSDYAPNAVLSEGAAVRSEEHTSELQSLLRISYAVFCWKKKRMTHLARPTLQHKHVTQLAAARTQYRQIKTK